MVWNIIVSWSYCCRRSVARAEVGRCGAVLSGDGGCLGVSMFAVWEYRKFPANPWEGKLTRCSCCPLVVCLPAASKVPKTLVIFTNDMSQLGIPKD